MAGLVINEQTIDREKVISKRICVQRTSQITLGVRVWFQILSVENELFQRWSMTMHNTDEVLVLVREGDTLDIEYIEDEARDDTNFTFEPFTRKVILRAAFV